MGALRASITLSGWMDAGGRLAMDESVLRALFKSRWNEVSSLQSASSPSLSTSAAPSPPSCCATRSPHRSTGASLPRRCSWVSSATRLKKSSRWRSSTRPTPPRSGVGWCSSAWGATRWRWRRFGSTSRSAPMGRGPCALTAISRPRSSAPGASNPLALSSAGAREGLDPRPQGMVTRSAATVVLGHQTPLVLVGAQTPLRRKSRSREIIALRTRFFAADPRSVTGVSGR